jgi:hypothetical protein
MSTHIEKRALNVSNLDPFGFAEELIGEDDEKAVMAVGHTLLKRQREMSETLWQELGDTYHDIGWEEFNQLLNSNGFITLKRWRFPYRLGWSEDATIYDPEAIIAADPERKLLLTATSFLWTDSKETLNGGMIHGAVEIDSNDWLSMTCDIRTSTQYTDGAWEMDMDIREGLFTKLRTIEEAGGKFVSWNAVDRYIYLDDYSNIGKNIDKEKLDFKDKKALEEHRRKRQNQIAQFLSEVPAEVREFMQK